jgi:NAD(P)-dependent dehydrogenase (short-subunit alcohol dehydrogenase family)
MHSKSVLVYTHSLEIIAFSGTNRMPTERDFSKSEDPSPIAPLRKFAYNASKAAVNVFTVHLAAELKDTNIKVNSTHPGWVKTALGSDAAPMSVADGAKTTVAVALLG